MACNIIHLGENSTAFICGHKDHECNTKGPLYFEFNDGEFNTLNYFCKKENINPNFCEKDKLEILYERGYIMTSQSCSCSICNEPLINYMYVFTL